jgi:ABC-type sugar transport system ATPase subunit
LLAAERAEHTPGETLLEVSGLTTAKLRGVSFALRRGEVLGVAGLVGSGRSELGAALVGLDPVLAGEINLKGKVGLLPEDRKQQGLMMQMSVMENGTLAVLDRMQTFGFIHGRAERASFDPLLHRLALKCASVEAPVKSLSGGNQQKALLARWLLYDPDVLFLDDPARGIDVGAKQDIYRIIDELARSGKGVLLVSSELPELLRCSDRILVLNEGRVAGTLDAAGATQERIMELAAGVPQ